MDRRQWQNQDGQDEDDGEEVEMSFFLSFSLYQVNHPHPAHPDSDLFFSIKFW
jgi:hypothetical protein